MHLNLISAAVPVFFAAILVESFASAKKQGRSYRFGAAIADLDTGLVSQLVDPFLRGVGVFFYAAVYRHRVISFDEGSLAPWVVGLVGIDFLYYWWHRASHRLNLLWAVHAVHHQSQDFNLAVALRQPALEALTIIPFHLPLALVGVDPWIYASCYAIDLIYQFFIHTEWVPRRASWEWVLNTPSCHRVHHGINPRYLDRNFGGILALWDRVFGTFEPETERAVYGVTHRLASYNPVWGNWAPLRDLAGRVAATSGGLGKLHVLTAHPAWRSSGSASDEPPAPPVEKYDPTPPRFVAWYVALHFIILLASGSLFLSVADRGVGPELLLPAAALLVSSVALGGWTEGRTWALALDLMRQIAALAVIFALPGLTWGVRVLASSLLALAFAVIFGIFRPYRYRPPTSATSSLGEAS